MDGATEIGLVDTRQVSEQKGGSYTISASRILLPKKVLFTIGVGVHEDCLVSFELALRDAGIEKYNLVTVSSIFPPGCEIVGKEEGLRELMPGQIVYCVMARMTSNEEGKKIFASVGAAIPEDPALNGYLTEYHGYYDGKEIGKHAEDMAAYMLETNFGVKAAKKLNATVTADVERYTTVVAAAVFVM
jgi:arginine decarboxylase